MKDVAKVGGTSSKMYSEMEKSLKVEGFGSFLEVSNGGERKSRLALKFKVRKAYEKEERGKISALYRVELENSLVV